MRPLPSAKGLSHQLVVRPIVLIQRTQKASMINLVTNWPIEALLVDILEGSVLQKCSFTAITLRRLSIM